MYPAAGIVKYDCLVKMVNCLIELYRVQFRFVVNVYCICTVLHCTASNWSRHWCWLKVPYKGFSMASHLIGPSGYIVGVMILSCWIYTSRGLMDDLIYLCKRSQHGVWTFTAGSVIVCNLAGRLTGYNTVSFSDFSPKWRRASEYLWEWSDRLCNRSGFSWVPFTLTVMH